MAEVYSHGKAVTDTMVTMPMIRGKVMERCGGVMAQYIKGTGTRANKVESGFYSYRMAL